MIRAPDQPVPVAVADEFFQGGQVGTTKASPNVLGIVHRPNRLAPVFQESAVAEDESNVGMSPGQKRDLRRQRETGGAVVEQDRHVKLARDLAQPVHGPAVGADSLQPGVKLDSANVQFAQATPEFHYGRLGGPRIYRAERNQASGGLRANGRHIVVVLPKDRIVAKANHGQYGQMGQTMLL